MKITPTENGQVWEFAAKPTNGFSVSELVWDHLMTHDGNGMALTDCTWDAATGFRLTFEHVGPCPHHRQTDFAALLEKLTALSI